MNNIFKSACCGMVMVSALLGTLSATKSAGYFAQSSSREYDVVLSSLQPQAVVVEDSNRYGEDNVSVSLAATSGPNPIKVTIYKKVDSGYTAIVTKTLTFEDSVSASVGGSGFKVAAYHVSGNGDCTVNVALK